MASTSSSQEDIEERLVRVRDTLVFSVDSGKRQAAEPWIGRLAYSAADL
jgi:hypothetical protein